MTIHPIVPIKAVAKDLQPLLQQYRDTNISFQDLPIMLGRQEYVKSCQTLGLELDLNQSETIQCPVEGGEIALRIYRSTPKTNKIQPALLFIHGGGWVIGNLESHDAVCRYLANKTGLPLIAVDYRLAPEHKFPIPLNDCVTALSYLTNHAQELAIDPQKIIVIGDSAGGNLATILAHQFNDHIKGNIIGQILIYPSVDFSKTYPSHDQFRDGLPLTTSTSQWFARHYLTGTETTSDPLLSPILLNESQNNPRSFVVTVGYDPLRDEGIAYANKLADEGCYVEHYHYPDQIHGIISYTAKVADSRNILDRATQFIKESIA